MPGHAPHRRRRTRAHAVLAVLAAVLLAAGAAQAKTHVVRQDGSGEFDSIQDALLVAEPGDELLIGPGVWNEGTLSLARSITLTSSDGPDATFLDGGGVKRVIEVREGAEVDITGFTIRNGWAANGAGLLIDFGVAHVRKCVLRDNRAVEVGGGAHVNYILSRAYFELCDVVGNQAGVDGGGVMGTALARLELNECRLFDNKAGELSGGLSATRQVILRVDNCEFAGNEGPRAGALDMFIASGFLRHNTFHGNTSGMASVVLSSPTTILFAGNIVSGERRGRGVIVSADMTMGCNIYHDNAGGALEGAQIDLTSLEADPLFCDPGGYDFGVCADSPALVQPYYCGVVGARSAGCGPCGQVAVEAVAWGSLKSMYR
jgi:hypothetical protein